MEIHFTQSDPTYYHPRQKIEKKVSILLCDNIVQLKSYKVTLACVKL